jgi:hypothetical protein
VVVAFTKTEAVPFLIDSFLRVFGKLVVVIVDFSPLDRHFLSGSDRLFDAEVII